jgi:hypothetical protein
VQLPATQGSKVENCSQYSRLLPLAPLVVGADQLPATPAAGHHLGGQAKLLQGVQWQGSAAEGRLFGPLQAFNQSNAGTGPCQATDKISTGRAGAHHQHIQDGQTATGWGIDAWALLAG